MKIKFTTLFLFLLLFSAVVFSQENTGQKWTRININKNELSLAFPPGFIVDTTEKKSKKNYLVSGFQNDVQIKLTAYETVDAERRVKILPNGEIKKIPLDKNKPRVNVRSSNESKSYCNTHISVTSKDFYYYISIISPDKSKPEIERVIQSIKVNGENVFVNEQNKVYVEEAVSIDSLKTSIEAEEAYNRKIEKRKINITRQLFNEDDEILSYAKYSRPPIVLEQPRPEFRSEMRGVSTSYKVQLKVTLLANGQIGDITLLSNEQQSITDDCVKAVRKMRFIPAQIDGKNADSETIITYSMQFFASNNIMR